MERERYKHSNDSDEERRYREALKRRRKLRRQKYLRRKRRIFLMKVACVFFALIFIYRFATTRGEGEEKLEHNNVIAAEESTPLTEKTGAQTVYQKMDKLIVVDAGHGGNDPGCNTEQYYEKDLVLSISKILQEKLEKYGFDVLMTRESDVYLGLSERAQIANTAKADAFVSIHCNAYEFDSSISGTDCYYYQSEGGKELAQEITNAFTMADIKTRETKKENFEVLRESNMTGVLVEVGFLSNAQELNQMINQDYQEQLATAIADGILKYYS